MRYDHLFSALVIAALTAAGTLCHAAPTITTQPVSAVVTVGGTASLSVTAGGTTPYSYQWLKDGAMLPGQTNATLTYAAFQFTNSGSYRVVITNAQGMVISRPASLSVANAPLQAWGYNYEGQLGMGNTSRENKCPVSVASNVVAVAAGSGHSLFVKADGTLWATGKNLQGQLGIGNNTDTNQPVSVASNVVTVAAGYDHSLFVKADGTLWAMGYGNSGQLGNGSSGDINLPVSVASNVVAVAAGTYHSLFVKADGTLWLMGSDRISSYFTPQSVASNVVAVAAGYRHSLFVKADGTLWAMGQNDCGQLGNGNTSPQNLPIKVASNVVAVAAGGYHSLFMKADGTLWAMGMNSSGQLGNGNTTEQDTPVSVASNVVAVAAGYYHSLLVKADGTLWAMGSNGNGQLGNGTNISQKLPVMDMTVISVASLGAMVGANHSLAVAMAKTLATVTLSTNLTQTYNGTAKPVSVVTSPANLTVSVTYNGSATAPTSVGRYPVIATVNDSTYYGSATATLVIRTTPSVTTWPTASAIPYGQTLASSALSGGSASVAGSFVWTTPGTAPAIGTTSQGVTFTPADAGLYDSVSGTVNVVAVVPPTITTVAVSGRTPGGATLNAAINPNGYPVGALFQYSTNMNFSVAATVSTLAGSDQFNGPWGVAADASGSVYVADTGYNRICKVTAAGVVTTLAGSGENGYADGTGTAAQFASPQGVAVDSSGNVYVADAGNRCIRKVTAAGVVTTLAGLALNPDNADGPGTAARFNYPTGVAVDTSGNVYVADYNNYSIRLITTSSPAILAQSGLTGASRVNVSLSLTGLVAQTTYYYRALATNSLGTITGETLSFTTPAASTVTLASSPNPSTYGSNVTLTATVSTNTATGTVTFMEGTQTLDSGILTGGVASFTLSNLAVGDHSITAVYTGDGNYGASTSSALTQVISQATATVTLSNLNQTYTGSALNATASTTPAGLTVNLTYNSSANAPTNPGSFTVVATIADVNYTGSATNTLVISKAMPSVTTWPSATAITYGQTLADSTLSGGVGAGTFAFTTPATDPNAGSASQAVTFTPTAAENYQTVSGSVSVTVSKATTSITTAPTASVIVYGQALASSSLSGGVGSVAGSFAFTTPTTAPNAGSASQGVTFTPTAAENYQTVSGSVSVTVSKATTSITTAPTASVIVYGQTLASTSLSGGVGSVAGSFAFTTPTTAPNAGSASQGVTFTPTDSTNYTTAVSTVSVTVSSYTAQPATMLGLPVANPDGSGKILTFAAMPNFAYQVEASDDLENWSPLATITAGADGHLVIIDTGAGNERFYRFKK
ncbi:MAG: MBG domain-containing protein [Verrucomicrobiota bacterium]